MKKLIMKKFERKVIREDHIIDTWSGIEGKDYICLGNFNTFNCCGTYYYDVANDEVLSLAPPTEDELNGLCYSALLVLRTGNRKYNYCTYAIQESIPCKNFLIVSKKLNEVRKRSK